MKIRYVVTLHDLPGVFRETLRRQLASGRLTIARSKPPELLALAAGEFEPELDNLARSCAQNVMAVGLELELDDDLVAHARGIATSGVTDSKTRRLARALLASLGDDINENEEN